MIQNESPLPDHARAGSGEQQDRRSSPGPRLSGSWTRTPRLTEGAGLLVMDVDSTLIEQEVIDLIAEHAGTREQVAQVTERAMRGELDFTQSLRERVATLAGLRASVLDEVLTQVRPTEGAAELIQTLHQHGWKVGVVSGGFEEVVQPLVTRLDIDHRAANRLEVVDGVLTGQVLGRVVDRQEKARCLQEWAVQDGVPLERTVALGDGANDLAMIEQAGLGIAFCARPVVVRGADAAVHVRDLRAVLEMLA